MNAHDRHDAFAAAAASSGQAGRLESHPPGSQGAGFAALLRAEVQGCLRAEPSPATGRAKTRK